MSDLLFSIYFKICAAKKKAGEMLVKENGEANIIAIILIIAIVVALAIVFRKNIKSLFDNIWGSVTDNVDSATGTY